MNNIEWNKVVNSMLESLNDFDKISENRRNIYESHRINHTIITGN